MVKLTESFMDKKLIKIIQRFINKHLNTYKFVYLTCDFRGFFRKYYPINANNFCEKLISCLLNKGLTVIIPAYSYTSKGKFNITKTTTGLSYISKWALKKKYFRTSHPIFSVFVIGKNQNTFKLLGKSAFGNNSFWEKLSKNKSSLLHIGRPFSLGNTIIHYVENNVRAKYRFHKVFSTKVYKGNKYIGNKFSAFVQKSKYERKKIETDTKKISKLIEKTSFYKKIGKDKNFTNLTHLDFNKAYNFMVKSFSKNNRIFIKQVR